MMEHLERVRVYRNLKTGNWSIQTKTPEGWRVRGYATSVELLDANCHVSDAGRARVLRDKCKNVHAYIEGTIDFRNVDGWPYGDSDLISYDPYEAGTFTTSDGEPVAGARRVRFNPNHSVHAIGAVSAPYCNGYGVGSGSNRGLQSSSTETQETGATS